MNPSTDDSAILAIQRPHRDLLTYFLLAALAFPPAFPILAVVLYFRYHTMRYTFTDEGISMRWGILFRREIILSYARIQDIHLRANFVERWLGLARILVQTASGSAGAEMTIEGLKEFEAVRDFLYHRMRGVKDPAHRTPPVLEPRDGTPNASFDHELAAALREVAHELRETRRLLAERQPPAGHV